jgi:hypothetical protein
MQYQRITPPPPPPQKTSEGFNHKNTFQKLGSICLRRQKTN